MKITQIRNQIKDCKSCPLHVRMPGCPVPGTGPSTANLMLIGEALGEDEAINEEPFVGRCGKLLNKMIENAGFQRLNVYITNIVKCRPTRTKGKRVSNRAPTPEEIRTCKHWVWKEMKFVKPKVVVTLGGTSTKTMLHQALGKTFKLGDVVGKQYKVDYINSIFIPAYHPSYLMVHRKDLIDQTTTILKQAYKLSKNGNDEIVVARK